jgi:hypothetical protein
MAASTVARERALEVAAAREHMGARDRDWLDRTVAVLGRSAMGR